MNMGPVLARSAEYMYSLIMYMSMHSIFAGFLLIYTAFYKRVGVRMTNSNKQLCSLLHCMLELNQYMLI